MKIYGYVRSENEEYLDRLKFIENFSDEVGIEFGEILIDIKCDGRYQSIGKIKEIIKNEKDIIVVCLDTTDLFMKYDEEIEIIRLAMCFGKNNNLFVNASDLSFDINEVFNKENPNGYLLNRLKMIMEISERLCGKKKLDTKKEFYEKLRNKGF